MTRASRAALRLAPCLVALCAGALLGRLARPEPSVAAGPAGETLCVQESCLPGLVELGDRLGLLLGSPDAVASGDLQKGLAAASAPVELAPPADGAGPSLPALYEQACKSVYILAKPKHCESCGHTHFESATGFAISRDGVLVTNCHVLDGDYAALAAVDAEGVVHPVVEVLAASRIDDLALLRIRAATTPLPVRGEAPVGTHIAVIGHPGMRFYTLTEGIVSRYWSDGEAKAPSVAITAEYAVGSSGSPVLDDAGNVVAVGAATQPISADAEGKTLQMVVKRCATGAALMKLAGG